jgi:hypothetical protein
VGGVLFGGGQLGVWKPETWVLIERDRCDEPANCSSQFQYLQYLLLQSWISSRLSRMLGRQAQAGKRSGQQIAWNPGTWSLIERDSYDRPAHLSIDFEKKTTLTKISESYKLAYTHQISTGISHNPT